jgi:pyridoxine 5-phosphate synthase
MSTAFSVNLNKIALLRNSRGTGFPDVVSFARRAIGVGVDGITVHPRPDQRHTTYQDVRELSALVREHRAVEFNVEGNPVPGFMDIVRQTRPHQATLVPDAEGQLTSDHGWQLSGQVKRVAAIVAELKALGIRVSLFMDPSPADMALAKQTGADRIELYTEPYAKAFGTASQAAVVGHFAEAAAAAQALGLGVNAGHDLNLANLGVFLAGVPNVLEVSIGHALMVESFDYGWEETLRRYCAIARRAPSGR